MCHLYCITEAEWEQGTGGVGGRAAEGTPSTGSVPRREGALLLPHIPSRKEALGRSCCGPSTTASLDQFLWAARQGSKLPWGHSHGGAVVWRQLGNMPACPGGSFLLLKSGAGATSAQGFEN